jgi:hypothetical protein
MEFHPQATFTFGEVTFVTGNLVDAKTLMDVLVKNLNYFTGNELQSFIAYHTIY